ncbi:MAG: hypothetical protein H0X12_05150 [Nocardioides sp.]|nr:hypothetical protein [Nocardioides sp.]
MALGRREESLGDDLLVITQNVDDLHERGGSKNVLHMHGELRSALCLACGDRVTWAGDLSHSPACPGCAAAMLRSDIVWFGEIPYRMDEALQALQEADLFVSIGTSSVVYPAAAFAHWAAEQGAHTLELELLGDLRQRGSESFRDVGATGTAADDGESAGAHATASPLARLPRTSPRATRMSSIDCALT